LFRQDRMKPLPLSCSLSRSSAPTTEPILRIASLPLCQQGATGMASAWRRHGRWAPAVSSLVSRVGSRFGCSTLLQHHTTALHPTLHPTLTHPHTTLASTLCAFLSQARQKPQLNQRGRILDQVGSFLCVARAQTSPRPTERAPNQPPHGCRRWIRSTDRHCGDSIHRKSGADLGAVGLTPQPALAALPAPVPLLPGP
jgi:hypothetical protein